MLSLLQKLNRFFVIKSMALCPSYCCQKQYLNKFREPVDDIERSYFQYLSQKYINSEGVVFSVIKNLVSLIVFLYYWMTIKDLKGFEIEIKKAVLVGGAPNLLDVLPRSLIKEYGAIHFKLLNNEMSLDKQARVFIIRIIKRYPLSWSFTLKAMIKIANYNYVIQKYSPFAIISSCEYSFTSSILTYYCTTKNVEHINVMHGEKWFYIRDSFVRFSKFFVWDSYYVELFTKMRADIGSYIVELPAKLEDNIQRGHYKTKTYDFKFYLALESHSTLSFLSKIAQALCSAGFKLSFRPHPRYTDIKLLNAEFDDILNDIHLENPVSIDIYDSIVETKHVVAVGSTVLFQAYLLGIPIVIDNISNPQRYKQMSDADYIMLHKPHELLSDIVSKLRDTEEEQKSNVS